MGGGGGGERKLLILMSFCDDLNTIYNIVPEHNDTFELFLV